MHQRVTIVLKWKYESNLYHWNWMALKGTEWCYAAACPHTKHGCTAFSPYTIYSYLSGSYQGKFKPKSGGCLERERKIERKWLVTLSGLKREGDQGGLLQAFLLFLFQNHIPLKEASVEHRISNWPCICLWRARWVLDIRGIRFQFQFQVLLCWERT